MTASPIEDTLMRLLAARSGGKSVAPEEVARSLEPEAWRRLLPQVRSTCIGLARQGRLVITRHGKPADPDQFRGVYRLRLPLPDDAKLPHEAGVQGASIPTEETP